MYKLIKYEVIAIILALIMVPVTQARAEDTFVITPRVWFINQSVELESDINSVISYEDSRLTLYGISVDYAPVSQKNFHYTLSYFTTGGSYTDEVTSISYSPPDPVKAEITTSEQERSDLEFLVRYRIPDSIVTLAGGYRRVNTDGTRVNSSGSSKFEFVSDYGELGVGFGAPIFKDSDRHHVFANLIYGLGRSELKKYNGNESFDTTILDTNIGYQFLATDNLSLNFRYRHLSYDQEIITTSLEGPELGLSYSF